MLRLRVAAAGLLRDFWKDGDQWPFLPPRPAPMATKERPNAAGQIEKSSERPLVREGGPKLWKADRIQILAKMWGGQRVIPGDESYLKALTSPLGLNREMSVLDMGAGLGDLARYMAEEYETYVTGLEQDQLFAARGMVLSIAAGKSKQASIIPYDPSIYTASRKYDAIIARQIFYRVVGKDVFFKAVDSSLKNGGGHLVITDYLLEPEAREKKAVKAWLAHEASAAPMSQAEVNKAWKGRGYDVRIFEDQTEDHMVLILKGLTRFVEFLASHKPDPATKKLIAIEVEQWVMRYMALQDGLKYYRIHAIKR